MEGKELNALNSSVYHFGVCIRNPRPEVVGVEVERIFWELCSQMNFGNKVSVLTKHKHPTESPARCPLPRQLPPTEPA